MLSITVLNIIIKQAKANACLASSNTSDASGSCSLILTVCRTVNPVKRPLRRISYLVAIGEQYVHRYNALELCQNMKTRKFHYFDHVMRPAAILTQRTQ